MITNERVGPGDSRIGQFLGRMVDNAFMKPVFLLGSLICGLVLCGCSPKPSLVGKWTGEMMVMERAVPSEIEVGSDGKMSINFGQGGIGIATNYSYTSTDKALTMTLESYEMRGEVPPMVKVMVDSALKELDKSKGKPVEVGYTFTDADNLEVTYANGTKATWTRVKAE